MKTNESVILAHGWKKNVGILGGHPQSYSKNIHNIDITIYLSKNGNYWLSISNYVNLLNNIDVYIAVAEELKSLNIETAK